MIRDEQVIRMTEIEVSAAHQARPESVRETRDYAWLVECDNNCGQLGLVARRSHVPINPYETDMRGVLYILEVYSAPRKRRCIRCGPFPKE